MDYCINCGADLTDDMEKCPECGAARLMRRPAPFNPAAYKKESFAVREPEPITIKEEFIPEVPEEEILLTQPAPVSSGHEPGEPASIIEELTDMSELADALAVVKQTPEPVVDLIADPVADVPTVTVTEQVEEYFNDPAYDVLTTGQYFGTVLLMGIPIIGWLATLIWALGGTKNFNRRNLARGVIFSFLLVLGVICIGVALCGFFLYGNIMGVIQNLLGA